MRANKSREPSDSAPDPVYKAGYKSSVVGSPTGYLFERLEINLKMDDHAYIQTRTTHISHPNSEDSTLPEERLSAATTPSTSAYGTHDIPVTYSSVAPFSSYSGSYDSPSLPTPVSVAGSPSLPETSGKMVQPYNQQGRNSQQPTPPATSHQWSYPITVPSTHSTSPMPLQPSSNELLEMQSLETTHSGDDHGPLGVSSPQFHWGPYGVSSTEAHDDMSPNISHQPLYPVQVPSVAPSALVRTSLPLAPSQVPILQGSPDPRDLASSMSPLAHPHYHTHFGPLGHGLPTPIQVEITAPYRRGGKSKRNTHNRTGKRNRPDSRKSNGEDLAHENRHNSAAGSHTQSQGTGQPIRRLELGPKAKDEDRYLLKLRLDRSGEKGKGMWESIAEEFAKVYGFKERASLQMQLSRAVQKHGLWPDFEDEALRRAIEELERRRYTDVLKLMKEYGGCQVWDWKESNVAKRLVELGIDEFDPEDATKKPRRQRKNAVRKHSMSGPWVSTHMHIPYEDDIRTVSSEQEKYFLELDFCKQEAESPGSDLMDGISEHPTPSRISADRDTGDNQSARVAKQVCDQVLGRRPQLLSSYGP
ncbi:hypothetical protein F4778DRAFT_301312 [Xylariomycetidae sp. FL2044]|nr:hypothetical protein F4778DRAFT_301312 [Xylariomycetidae sp. FL2044]